MAVIEIPDGEAAALAAKAATEGLSLADWLKKLADVPENSDDAIRRAHEAAEGIREIGRRSKPDPDGSTVFDYLRQDRQR
jgi:hypothetical protein